jgi:4-hydroxy-4-methyl-2-oxoglutarate aldolase
MVNRPTIIRQIARPSSQGLLEMAELGVATLHEAYGRRGLMHGMLPITLGAHICGPAVTSLNHAGDNLMLHAAVDVCEPGDVLVVSTTAPSLHGMFGELLATLCVARGIIGVVLDAAVRDVELIRGSGFGVWARGISASGTTKSGLGWVNIPISCAGAVVFPGDVIVGDDDGIIVVERELAASVVEAARQRSTREQAVRGRFASGESSLDVGGWRGVLDAGSVLYEP